MLPILFSTSPVIGGITLLSVVVPAFVSAATWPAVDAQEVNVASAIAKASNGDTVTVPPGVATWSSQLTITKHITLQGAGVGQTIIYDNAPKGGGDQHLILVKLSGDNPPFRLSGFEFGIPANYKVKAQPYGVGILEFQGGGGAVVPGMSANVRIDHCKIKVAGVAMTFRNVLGLVDHVEWIDCRFTNPTTASYWGGWQSACIYMPKWGGKDWGHGSWADAANWGTDKFLFFEDCSFTGLRRNNILSPIDAYEGARYAARNCTFKDANVGGTGTEGQGRGKKQVECYNNTFISTELFGNAQSSTSGTILVHDNLETNYRNGVRMDVYRQFEGKLWGQSTGRSPWDENDDFPQAYQSGTCTAIASLGTARSYHTAALLANGNVLVVAGIDGTNALASAELYDSVNGTWTMTGSLGTARELHTSTLLPDGKVLVVGGTDGTNSLASAELYDPGTGRWSASGSLRTARYYHTATLLPNGSVLVAGGYDGTNSLANAELYDPATGTWTTTGNLGTGRYSDTATLLPNGTVLLAGGYDGTNSLASAELYDPATGAWSATASLGGARNLHTATLLPNGTVLVAGGYDGANSLASAELYDPATGTWTTTGNLATARYYYTATLLPNGTVLVAGGYDGTNSLASAELYDPATGTWTTTGNLGNGRYSDIAILLPNGKVLVVGGHDDTNFLVSAQLYDPAIRAWKAGNNVTDKTKTWVPDQWLGDGVSFIIINLSSPVDKNGEHAQTYLIGNTSNTLKQGKTAPFQVGDKYEIWKVKTSLDQPGQGSGILLTGLPPNASPVTWPQRGYPREPCYSWNNIDPTNGTQMDIIADEPSIKLGRDYFNRTSKPGYTPFVYPHPLVSGISSTPTPTPPPTPPPTPTPTPTPSPTPVSADLKITVSDSKTAIVAGAQDTYGIVVTNLGPSTVGGASVADSFPSSFGNVSYTATQVGGASGFTASGTGNINDTVVLPSGSKITYSAKGKLSSAATGTLSNTATVTLPNGVTDPNPANNSATDSDTITYQADLKVTVNDGKTAAVAGTKDTYTIVVTNAGTSNVAGATIQDNFSPTFTGVTFTATQTGGASGFTAAGSGKIQDTVSMPAASKITYRATGTISASATGSISNTASVTSPGGVPDPNLANNSATDTDTL
jgi:uncharacterized repeat protein (TIGR01451 family)